MSRLSPLLKLAQNRTAMGFPRLDGVNEGDSAILVKQGFRRALVQNVGIWVAATTSPSFCCIYFTRIGAWLGSGHLFLRAIFSSPTLEHEQKKGASSMASNHVSEPNLTTVSVISFKPSGEYFTQKIRITSNKVVVGHQGTVVGGGGYSTVLKDNCQVRFSFPGPGPYPVQPGEYIHDFATGTSPGNDLTATLNFAGSIEVLADTNAVWPPAGTVSSGPDSIGMLDCLAKHVMQSMRHDSTESAVNNLLSTVTGRPAMTSILGHGNVGFVETGCGKEGVASLYNVIIWWSRQIWASKLIALSGKKFDVLSIFSCDTGAEEEGADLLFDIATVIDKPAQARTGLTICDARGGIRFEPGSEWQLATPRVRPSPKHRPKPRPDHPEMGDVVVLTIDNIPRAVPLQNLSKIEFVVPEILSGRSRKVSFGTGETIEFARRHLSSPPFNLGGLPLAFPTAYIALTLVLDGSEHELKLTIYNDRIALDEAGTARYLGHPLRSTLLAI
jgi:hypothetical protein